MRIFSILLALLVHPDLSLIGQALKGRSGATRLLVQRLLPVIRARCRVFLGRRPGGQVGFKDLEDLTQEVWLVLLEGDGRLLRAYDPDRGMSLEGYVGLLTQRQLWRNVVAQQAQKRDAPTEALDDDTLVTAGETPEAALIGQDLEARLGAHLAEVLPPRGSLVWRALFTDQRDPEEVASVLGVNRQVVYNWQHRIRSLARSFLTQS